MKRSYQNPSLQFAQEKRNTLRSSQAKTTSILRIDKTIHEVLLEITWRVAEKLSGNRLPR
jgi:hypothetical protein